MVGIAGAIGSGDISVEKVNDHLAWQGTEQRETVSCDQATLTTVTHSCTSESVVSSTSNEFTAHVWGNVWGRHLNDGYQSRHQTHPELSEAEYCATLYREYGIEFVEQLNGDFAMAIFDQRRETVFLVTDRLGSRPFYIAQSDDCQAVLFSSLIQSLKEFSGNSLPLDCEYLVEFFGFNRVFGNKTPLRGVTKSPPATVVSIDTGSLEKSEHRYWYPKPNPQDKSYNSFVREFVDTLKEVVTNQVRNDERVGLMLSGGSDSRLLAPLCPTGSKAYHLAGWLSKESQTAERVALEEGLDFTWLKRGQDYIVNLAEESVRINNFNGYFQEAHALGFIDQIKTDSDAVIHGLFSDAFFKGHLYPQKSIPVGFEEIPVPVADSINDVTELVDWLTSNSRSPSYVPDRFNIRQILSDNIEERSDGVVHHGIEYDTVEEAATVGGYFPLTNDGDYNHYGAAIQMCPHRTPFLDTRILDFHLRYPMRYQLRKNIIDDAIECLNKELASIPHGSSNVPLNFPFWIKLPAKYATLFWRKYVQDTPQPHLSHGPWVDHSGLVRTSRFVDEAISENSSFLESLDCVDYGKLAQCLSGHKNGIENNWRELYAIVTLVYRRSSR